LRLELDVTYRAVGTNFPNNRAIRIEQVDGKDELILTALDKLDEPSSLVELRERVAARLPRVDLPEILLEIAVRTGFTNEFTHISERDSRVSDLSTSLCAVLLCAVLIAEACNTGAEPLVRTDVPALRRSRLSWVNQNYVRNETLAAANACPKPDSTGSLLGWGRSSFRRRFEVRGPRPNRSCRSKSQIFWHGPGRDVLQSRLGSISPA